MDKTIGARVRALRIDCGVSQEALGQALGVTFQQIQKYENGTNRISGARLLDIANKLAVDVSYFYPKSDRGDGSSTFDAFIRDKDGIHIMMAFVKMGPYERSIARALVDTLLTEQEAT